MSDAIALLVAVLLLFGNAFFVGAEFSVISARRDRLESMAQRGTGRARTVIKAAENIALMLAASQLGITICSLGLGSLGEPAIAHQLERVFEPLGVPEALLHPIAFVIALGIVTVLHILLGEMVPKNIAIAGPERTALWMVPPLVAWTRAMRPVIWLLNVFARLVLRAIRVEQKHELESALTPDELANMIADSSQEGLLDQQERRRLTQTLATAERTVADVLVPIDRLVTVPAQALLGDVESAVADTGFSRYPMRDDNGGLVGYLHVKDILELAGQDAHTPIPPSSRRTLPEVSADSKLDDALSALRRAHAHLGRVVGGAGETVGVVALEDVVEEYVGTVRDAMHVTRQAGTARPG